MSVTVRKGRNGGFEVDVSVLLADGTTYRERKVLRTMSKSSANIWGQRRERQLFVHGQPRKKKEVPTLNQFASRFINEYAIANRQKPSGISNKQSVLKTHILPALGETRPNAVTTYDVEKLKFALKDKAPVEDLSLQRHITGPAALPTYLTLAEAAELLRTTPKALYVKNDRRQLPGVVRFGRRVLVHAQTLVDSLHQQGASSPQGVAR